MEVTCVPSPSRRSVLTILLDGEPWREVHAGIFGKKPGLPSICQSEEAFEELFAKVEVQMAKRYALKRLSLQNLLSDSLARSLKEKLVSRQAVDAVIGELSSLGWLNDQEWTASFVRGQSSKKMGPRAIAGKLASKGVRGERLEAALAEAWNKGEQGEQIASLLKGKYRTRDLSDFKERQKVIASLVRRGFELPVILSTLSIDFE